MLGGGVARAGDLLKIGEGGGIGGNWAACGCGGGTKRSGVGGM